MIDLSVPREPKQEAEEAVQLKQTISRSSQKLELRKRVQRRLRQEAEALHVADAEWANTETPGEVSLVGLNLVKRGSESDVSVFKCSPSIF